MWKAGFDAMGGASWTHCSDKREDPCGCSQGGGNVNVTCSGGHIMAIELHDNKLSGTLPAEWSNMTQIRHMSLNSNWLSGSLPAEWSNMTQITWIDLHNIHSASHTTPLGWAQR